MRESGKYKGGSRGGVDTVVVRVSGRYRGGGGDQAAVARESGRYERGRGGR